MERYLEASTEYYKGSSAIKARLLQLKNQNSLPRAKLEDSTRQSKLKGLKRDIVMKKLMLRQEQERAKYELEMERQKFEFEFKSKIKACEMKFQTEMAEKEAELLERYGTCS